MITLPHEEWAKCYIPSVCIFLQRLYGHLPFSCNITSEVEDTTIYTGYYFYVDQTKQKTIEEMRQVLSENIPDYKQLGGVVTQPGYVQVYVKSQGIPVAIANAVFTEEAMQKVVGIDIIPQSFSRFTLKITYTEETLANYMLGQLSGAIQYTNPINYQDVAASAIITRENDNFVLVVNFFDDVFDGFIQSIPGLLVNE